MVRHSGTHPVQTVRPFAAGWYPVLLTAIAV